MQNGLNTGWIWFTGKYVKKNFIQYFGLPRNFMTEYISENGSSRLSAMHFAFAHLISSVDDLLTSFNNMVVRLQFCNYKRGLNWLTCLALAWCECFRRNIEMNKLLNWKVCIEATKAENPTISRLEHLLSNNVIKADAKSRTEIMEFRQESQPLIRK